MNQVQVIKNKITVIDGNEAASDIAYRTNEVCAIFPITPSSNMGEHADSLAAKNKPNVFGEVPLVVEMQSEAGAIGAMHGAIQTGTLATTFTSSQGLLLMIPNMYKIAGELTPAVIHVAARSVATQSMSIYCDHSDAMSTRGTGFALLSSANVQEAHDMALIAQAISLESRVPFLHFFDGFRTSHEIRKIAYLSDEQILGLLNQEAILEHQSRRLQPENPFYRGSIQNGDIFFQTRESVSKFYKELPAIADHYLEKFEKLTGRHYELIEYKGDPNAEYVIVLMGSGVETAQETVDYLKAQGEKVGVIQVRLFRPFSKKHLLKVLPKTCKALAILDRTKEPGASGEPLYQEVSLPLIEAYQEGLLSCLPKMINGRFGISGKEFTPAMVKAIFDELKKDHPKNHFTIGIIDDVMHSHLDYDPTLHIESAETIRAIFYGLGADGTVGANKNTAKIIGEETNYDVQGYFAFDSKKSGSRTTSYLRFSPKKIQSAYLIDKANFIACHQWQFIDRLNVLERAAEGAVFLLNSIYSKDHVWDHLPCILQQEMINRKIKFYVIDAYHVAKQTGMGGRINTIMQTCFFALSGVLPKDEAIAKIKKAIAKTYARKGEEMIAQNYAAVDAALSNLFEVKIPDSVTSRHELLPPVSAKAPTYVKEIIGKILEDKGDDLKISQLPADGTFPTHSTQFEKRSIALEVPVWDAEKCIQCGRCSLVCPHSVIRAKQCDKAALSAAPDTLKQAVLRGKGNENKAFLLQIYPEDCMECKLCVDACPVKGKALKMQEKTDKLVIDERKNIEFFESLPYQDKVNSPNPTIQTLQFTQPMFEFCGACSGCGEAPYVKLMSQLFGDRMIIGTACGCSLVYGSMLPANPWVINSEGCGPSYSGSLFEDNAEFALGFVLSEVQHKAYAEKLLATLSAELGGLSEEILKAPQQTELEIKMQRERVEKLKTRLHSMQDHPQAKVLLSIANHLVKHSIWALGGDGWAYDIGYGGLDHVIASNYDLNILVLDTEVYSNTGGQASKSTPRGSVVKFAMQGKRTAKKDLGMMAMTYGNAYVASIAMGANPTQALQVFREADAYPGPSLILAYSPCIAHGIDMSKVLQQQQLAVKTGYWPLYRFNPSRIAEGLNPMQIDSSESSASLSEFTRNENRFKVLERSNPEMAKQLMIDMQEDIKRRYQQYQALISGWEKIISKK